MADTSQRRRFLQCPRCGAENLPTSKFCAQCGMNLRGEVQAPAATTMASKAGAVLPYSPGQRGPGRTAQLAVIFFAFVGLKFAFVLDAWPLIVTVTAVAFVGKLLGGIMGGRVAGFRGRQLVALGVGLNARGMMELLLAQVGLAAGIIDTNLYSALIVMTLTTTFCTPPLMKRLLRGFEVQEAAPAVSPLPSGKTADAHEEILEEEILH